MTNSYQLMSQLMDEFALEDALEAESVHGVLSFLAITGRVTATDDLAPMAWGEDLAKVPEQALFEWSQYCTQQLSDLAGLLHDGVSPQLPFEPTLDWQDSAQQAWCVGFMMALFEGSDGLPQHDTQAWAEAILPIEVGSGLFADSPEFASFYQDPELLSSLLEQIPELLIDLFLLLHTTAEDG